MYVSTQDHDPTNMAKPRKCEYCDRTYYPTRRHKCTARNGGCNNSEIMVAQSASSSSSRYVALYEDGSRKSELQGIAKVIEKAHDSMNVYQALYDLLEGHIRRPQSVDELRRQIVCFIGERLKKLVTDVLDIQTDRVMCLYRLVHIEYGSVTRWSQGHIRASTAGGQKLPHSLRGGLLEVYVVSKLFGVSVEVYEHSFKRYKKREFRRAHVRSTAVGDLRLDQPFRLLRENGNYDVLEVLNEEVGLRFS